MKKLLFTLMTVFLSAAMFANNFFVDASRPDNLGDGLSWETAKQTLPAAFTLAKTNNPASQADNIYVKEGIYSLGVTVDLTGVDCNGISLFGGYLAASAGTDITLRNITANPSILDGNNATIVIKVAQPVLVDGFIIQNGKDATYTVNLVAGGLVMSHASAVVSNCVIRNNSRTTGNNKGLAGGVYMNAGTLRSCEVYGNSTTHANSQAGGIEITGGTIERCKIYNNTGGTAGQVGGVLIGKSSGTINTYVALDANVVLVNNLIYNNNYQGVKVGLLAGGSKTVSLINNTIVNNGLACLLAQDGTVITAANNIFYNNGGNETFAIDAQYTYNAIQTASISGTGNIVASPAFTAPTASSGVIANATSDWSLGAASNCKDVGSNSYSTIYGATDAAGNTRVVNATVDMGALEASVSTAIENTKGVELHILSVDGGIKLDAVSAQVFNFSGQQVWRGSVNNRFIALPVGNYIVKAISATGINNVKKVIVK